MTGGLSPEQLGEQAERAAAGGLAVVATMAVVLIAAWALVEGYRIQRQQSRRRAAEERAQAGVTAEQLDAGIQAGWHDAGPADRRRDR